MKDPNGLAILCLSVLCTLPCGHEQSQQMDLPQSGFAVTAEKEITVFHHCNDYTRQDNHVIARLSRVITDHQSSALLFSASLFLALCPC